MRKKDNIAIKALEKEIEVQTIRKNSNCNYRQKNFNGARIKRWHLQ